MTEYNWPKSKALLASIGVGLLVAVPLFLGLVFGLVPLFEERDTRLIVSLIGGAVIGNVAALCGRLLYLTKASL